MQKLFNSNSRKQSHIILLGLTVVSLLFAGFCSFMNRPIIIKEKTRFSRLMVLRQLDSKKGHRMYECLCDCGTIRIVRASALVSQNTHSCGCLDKETRGVNLRRGHELRSNGATVNGKRTAEYDAYQHMKERCYNPKVDRYPCYGGRGIKVCDRWLESFSNFLADMGRKPSKNHSLDRFPNVNGDYEPSNCRWGTQEQQMSNKQNTVRLIVNGEEVHQGLLAKILGVNDHSIEYHLKKGKSGDEIAAHFKNKKQ